MPRRLAAVLAALTLAVPALTSCSGQPPPPKAATAAEKGLLVQTAQDVTRTAGSIRRLDDLPLYEMTFSGGYDAEAPLTDAELARKDDAWACSLFHRGHELGRNFDWQPNPAMVVRARPPGGYASLSLADISYVLDRSTPPDLASPDDRRRLAHAVLIPFDGMNEKGLAVGMAAVPTAELPAKDPARKTVGSVRAIRLMLDRAANVDEAVALLRTYNIEFSADGPQIHYLLADRSGKSVVVEYTAGKMHVIDDNVLTNFTMAGTSRARRLDDRRYRTLAENLGTKADGLALLESVAQAHTRWSVVYDLDAGTARLVTGQKWGTVRTLTLSSPG